MSYGCDMTHIDADQKKGKAEPGRPETLPTTPDPAAVIDLKAALDGIYAARRDEVREFLNDPEMAIQQADTLDQYRDINWGKVLKVAAAGIQNDSFSQANGGTGRVAEGMVGIEMLGHADLATMTKCGVQWGLWGGAVDNLGTERHKRFAEGSMNVTMPGSFGMTELGHGSDVQNIETTATYDPETKEFIVNSPNEASKKAYIGNAARDGQWVATFAQLYTPGSKESHGVHCIIVPFRDENGNALPGITIGDHGRKGGLLGVDNGTISFDNVRVPRENLLNRFADVDEAGNYHSEIESVNRRFFTMLSTLVRGRVGVGAAAGAATRTSLTIALRYATRRRQFPGLPGTEKRLIEHRQHRLRLLPRLARSYALAILQNELFKELGEHIEAINNGSIDQLHPTKEQDRAQRELEARAAAVKIANTAHATDTIQECREACGGAGYMEENFLTRFKADSDVYTTFEGDNTVLLQLVGKQMITSYAQDMGQLSPLEMAKFGVDNVAEVFRHRSYIPMTVQKLTDRFSESSENSIFDPAYQVKLIESREAGILKSLAARMNAARKLKDPADQVKAVDAAQDHLIAAGWARIDTMAIEAIVDAEQQIPENSPARPVFEQVRNLFALTTIHDHADWYLEHNLLSSARTKAARAAINDLVDSLGPWSDVLVDAFAVPDALTNVPMLNDAGVDEPAAK